MAHVFCSRCGRLIGDEPGDICDHCDPALRLSYVPPKTPTPSHNPITWILIALAILATCLSHAFSTPAFLPGAAFGPAVLSGQWWQLFTALFVHFDAEHLIGNLIFLWIFGKRVERILGRRAFLAFFLACGLAGGTARLILNPELNFCGASGAIFGFAGALMVVYGSRFRTLPGKQRFKFFALVLWSVLGFYQGWLDPSTDNIAHITGFCAGILLGALLGLRSGSDRRPKSYVFAGAGLVVIGMAICARYYNAYAIHLDAAVRAFDSGKNEVARGEVQAALAARPRSDMARSLARRLIENNESNQNKSPSNAIAAPPGGAK